MRLLRKPIQSVMDFIVLEPFTFTVQGNETQNISKPSMSSPNLSNDVITGELTGANFLALSNAFNLMVRFVHNLCKFLSTFR